MIGDDRWRWLSDDDDIANLKKETGRSINKQKTQREKKEKIVCLKQKSKEEVVSARHVARYGDRRGEVAACGVFLFYFINIDTKA